MDRQAYIDEIKFRLTGNMLETELDTNGFNLKTTSKTYNAASTLMEMGADSILKQELLKGTKDDYIKKLSYKYQNIERLYSISVLLN